MFYLEMFLDACLDSFGMTFFMVISGIKKENYECDSGCNSIAENFYIRDSSLRFATFRMTDDKHKKSEPKFAIYKVFKN